MLVEASSRSSNKVICEITIGIQKKTLKILGIPILYTFSSCCLISGSRKTQEIDEYPVDFWEIAKETLNKGWNFYYLI